MNTSKDKSAKSRLLLEDFRRFVDHFKPGYVFIENVPGLESKVDSPLDSFKKFLSGNGYAYDDSVINAAYYNVPQNRKRYVLIATRVTTQISVPKPRKNPYMTVRNFISQEKGFTPIPAGYKDSTTSQHITAGLSEQNLKRLRKTPKNGGTRMSWKDDPELQLPCYKGRDDIFCDVYGRLFWDQPSPTITTKFYSISNGRFAHPEQNRGLSLKEGAVLQSFPRSYKFYAESIGKIARMIGNAVPPNMAKKIGQAIINNRLNGKI